jgi:hypothetical protein
MSTIPGCWFGQPPPEGAQAAYGCRAILSGRREQYVDVFDRQQAVPDPVPEAFAKWVSGRLSNWLHNEPRTRRSKAFPDGKPAKNGIGWVDPGGDKMFTLDDGVFHAKACANRSHGYLYVGAWMDPE